MTTNPSLLALCDAVEVALFTADKDALRAVARRLDEMADLPPDNTAFYALCDAIDTVAGCYRDH
jgi:hypothetical protein